MTSLYGWCIFNYYIKLQIYNFVYILIVILNRKKCKQCCRSSSMIIKLTKKYINKFLLTVKLLWKLLNTVLAKLQLFIYSMI